MADPSTAPLQMCLLSNVWALTIHLQRQKFTEQEDVSGHKHKQVSHFPEAKTTTLKDCFNSQQVESIFYELETWTNSIYLSYQITE